ncbi:MAG TPA: hypothetical protein VMU84_20915 [Thermoanaerobaculia bacterium]|nr:hypothetical protein [Thermoanaerobaculia bacterium]
MATLIHGKVHNGRVEVEELEGYELPEGAEVTLFIRDDEDENGVDLPPDELAELNDRVEAAERGEVVDGEAYLRELRRRSGRE